MNNPPVIRDINDKQINFLKNKLSRDNLEAYSNGWIDQCDVLTPDELQEFTNLGDNNESA